jgi:hypothetical protein
MAKKSKAKAKPGLPERLNVRDKAGAWTSPMVNLFELEADGMPLFMELVKSVYVGQSVPGKDTTLEITVTPSIDPDGKLVPDPKELRSIAGFTLNQYDRQGRIFRTRRFVVKVQTAHSSESMSYEDHESKLEWQLRYKVRETEPTG